MADKYNKNEYECPDYGPLVRVDFEESSYEKGQGVTQSKSEAIKWYEKAGNLAKEDLVRLRGY